ncbi:hypothetical protein [Paraburkholderia polaris]|uniref:hypothetical protein n=1 Tax=Paraburkholderia polaris TaxID=2728848 RepID=UPI001E3E67F2|nr:hypothetical protein [Paraburkholderia polaris]
MPRPAPNGCATGNGCSSRSTASFTVIGCDAAATLEVRPAIVVLAVRFRWQLKVFTAADSGGAS